MKPVRVLFWNGTDFTGYKLTACIFDQHGMFYILRFEGKDVPTGAASLEMEDGTRLPCVTERFMYQVGTESCTLYFTPADEYFGKIAEFSSGEDKPQPQPR